MLRHTDWMLQSRSFRCTGSTREGHSRATTSECRDGSPGGCRTYQRKLSDRSNELSIKRDRGYDRLELGEQIGLVFPQVLLRRFVLEKFRQVALCKH